MPYTSRPEPKLSPHLTPLSVPWHSIRIAIVTTWIDDRDAAFIVLKIVYMADSMLERVLCKRLAGSLS